MALSIWCVFYRVERSCVSSSSDSQFNSISVSKGLSTLRLGHKGNYGVSSDQPHNCLPNRLFRFKWMKTPTLCVTGLCEGNSPVTSEFPTQKVSQPEVFLFDGCVKEKKTVSVDHNTSYSISQEICTRFCCALLCCGYAIVHNGFTWSIYPYPSRLLCWHWGNR